jgi:preprotein translocase SecF subunit
VFDFVGRRRLYFALSLALTIPGLLLILMGPITGGRVGLQFSIDYTGGTLWSIRFADASVTPAQVQAVFASEGLEASVSQNAEGFMDIRTEEVGLLPAPAPTPVATLPPPTGAPGASPDGSPAASPDASPGASPGASPAASPAESPEPTPDASPAESPGPTASPEPPPATGDTTLPTDGRLGEVRFALEDELGTIAEQQALTTIGAVVSGDLIRQALLLIVLGSVGILLWMTYRFHELKFGATALIALVHDVLIVVGAFAVLGTLVGLQIDGLFVTAMLTVIGFSVHDTIVVFDRVRENQARHASESFSQVVNHSVLQTLGRSITTSFTVIIVLLALLLFAGDAIGTFVFALLLGITAGTYSSIFVASPLLVVWHERQDRRRSRLGATRPTRRAIT